MIHRRDDVEDLETSVAFVVLLLYFSSRRCNHVRDFVARSLRCENKVFFNRIIHLWVKCDAVYSEKAFTGCVQDSADMVLFSVRCDCCENMCSHQEECNNPQCT